MHISFVFLFNITNILTHPNEILVLAKKNQMSSVFQCLQQSCRFEAVNSFASGSIFLRRITDASANLSGALNEELLETSYN